MKIRLNECARVKFLLPRNLIIVRLGGHAIVVRNWQRLASY
jgi:hypothetical protein